MTRKERIQKAFAHLIGEGIIKNKQQVADIMEVSRPSVSKAYNGYDSYLTNDFLKKFCLAFPNTFNVRWLIDEEGQMLVNSEAKNAQPSAMTLEEKIEQLLKQNDELISNLKNEQELNRRLMISIANEMADMKVAMRQMASDQPVKFYQVAAGDVNQAAMNDKLKEYK